MKRSWLICSSLVVPWLVLQTGCASHHGRHESHAMKGAHGAAPAQHAMAWGKVDELVAVLHSTEGNQARGTVRFTQEGDKVKVTADVRGLTPNQKHAIHVHEFGDCSAADGTSAGGHYNPEGHDHALPTQGTRHAGDLGNLTANNNGRARYEIVVDNITLAGLKNPIIGRSVIVHAQADDGGQPVGNAGARIACGVIGIGKGGM
ncbi:MAG TPA: superoxide dismutase family protein [Methylomirabilota bacterium]|nr:superoxide dismutase family protein [Methylomirabilota bacterium]